MSYEHALSQAYQLALGGHLSEARRTLHLAIAGRKLEVDALVVLAQIFKGSARVRAAETVLNRVLKSNPRHLAAFNLRAMIHIEKREKTAATLLAIRFLESEGKFAKIANVVRGLALTGMASMGRTFSERYLTARLYLVAGQFEKARTLFQTAPEREDADAELALIDLSLGYRDLRLEDSDWARMSKWTRHMLVSHSVGQGKLENVLSFLSQPAQRIAHFSSAKLDRTPGGLPRKLLISVLPKSGSAFLLDTMETLASVRTTGVADRVGDDFIIVPSWLDAAIANDRIPVGHFSATPLNARELDRVSLPVFAHIRDPRDATWSWFRYVEEMTPLEKMGFSYLPADYWRKSYRERLIIMYQRYYPLVLGWLNSWKNYIEHGRAEVAISRYEDFTRDNVAGMKRLLLFCGLSIPPDVVEAEVKAARTAGLERGAFHFREGRSGNWRDCAIPEVIATINAGKDRAVMEYFGYGEQ